MNYTSEDPVEQFIIEVHNLRTVDGKICNYRIGLDLQDEIRIAKILVEKISSMEREACATVCENAPEPDGRDLAKRIRERGQG